MRHRRAAPIRASASRRSTRRRGSGWIARSRRGARAGCGSWRSRIVVVVAAWPGVGRLRLAVPRRRPHRSEGHTQADAPPDRGGRRGIHHGDAMVWLDAGAAVAGIEALPWVAPRDVEREWPGTVTITVTERAPLAWVDTAAGLALVDRSGRVLERLTDAPTGVPQIAGAKFVPPVGGTHRAGWAARVAGAPRRARRGRHRAGHAHRPRRRARARATVPSSGSGSRRRDA